MQAYDDGDYCFPFGLVQCFLKEIENMFSVFLSSNRNTCESVGELEKGVETLAQHFLFSQTSTSVSTLYSSIEKRNMFAIS